MNNEPQMSDLPAEKQAAKAIAHTLRRIAEHTTGAYHCGHGTQVFALLTEAQAALTGLSIAEIRETFSPAQPDPLSPGSKRECPFCGGSYLEVVCGFAVNCGDCDFDGPKGDNQDEAIKYWNKRSIQRL